MNRIALITLLILIASCNSKPKTPEDVVRQKVESYLLPKLHDPDSYEFVSFVITDTIWNRKSWVDTTRVSIKSIEAVLEYRANNKFGAKVLKTSLIDLNENGEVSRMNL